MSDVETPAAEHPKKPVFWIVLASPSSPGVQVHEHKTHQSAMTQFRQESATAHFIFMTEEKPDHDGKPSNEILRRKD